MKIKLFFFLLFALSITSCVTRVDIPEVEDAKIFINCEMLKGERVTAKLSTSNNLGNQYPITFPEDARISIYKSIGNGSFSEEILDLVYEPASGLYVSHEIFNTNKFITPNTSYTLEAKINNSEVDFVTAVAMTPSYNSIESATLASEEVIEIDGQLFWQGVVDIVIPESYGSFADDYYYTLVLKEKRTTVNYTSNDTIYSFYENEGLKEFQVVDVIEGAAGVVNMVHKEGFLVQYKDLEEGHLKLMLRSNFPVTETNQVTHHIFADLVAVSKEHYDYHRSRSNMLESNQSVFSEPSLFRSNIKNGHGLFSSCIPSKTTLLLK